ncbi:MAG: AAA family ATPase [Nanoarchaeota archaeon]|nr:AAA family ATPase [Nanoarchaeota archaeon]
MIIKKVVLENIRSYLNTELDIPAGSLLLAGNIGSGKSTILMAIDFALFGIRRGELSGASLLRNGEDKGRVELHFEIDGKDVVINRGLKRSKTGVTQDSGFISIDNEEKKGTPIELKQHILDMLNYPKEALTKNDLLYRYTVYTSQEQMKQILTCDKEDRLNTLRKVFGIDKYKRISENAKIVISKLKDKRKELAGYISDLVNKRDSEKAKKEELLEFELKLKNLTPKLESSNLNVKNKKENISLIEKKMERIRELKKEIELADLKLKHLYEQKQRNSEEIKQLDAVITNFKKVEIKEDLHLHIENKKKDILELENSLTEIRNLIQELKVKKLHAEDKKSKISELNNCPTCFQEVSSEHKINIIEEETFKLNDLTLKYKLNGEKEQELNALKSKLNEDLDKLREEEKLILVAQSKLREFDEKINKKKSLEEQLSSIDKESKDLQFKKDSKLLGLKQFENFDAEFSNAKEDLDKALDGHRTLEVLKAELDTSCRMLKTVIESLEKEIANKEAARKNFEHISSLQTWLNDQFIPLMGNMEKHIMFRVHEDFSSLFSKWFSMLIENDSMEVKLDNEFTPLIEQNGYETDYDFLSGGEKTGAALAYRLALNQVINNIMSSIKTRSIIILDEPTDGFSSEQLDNMRAVLDELSIGQIIIVSHEPKIESFVENVIRFEKNEHISKVL